MAAALLLLPSVTRTSSPTGASVHRKAVACAASARKSGKERWSVVLSLSCTDTILVPAL